MLILARGQDERIVVGDFGVITVVQIGPGKVRLGFEFPADVEIDREEIRHDKLRFGRRQPTAANSRPS